MDTREIERARAAIGDEGDGPITMHELVSRGMHRAVLATSSEALDVLIEALYEELYDRYEAPEGSWRRVSAV